MYSLFRTRFSRSAAPCRRRRRTGAPAMPLERLEPRLALANDTVSRPTLEQATALVMDQSMGPNPVLLSKAQVVGNDVKSFVISHVPLGSIVEKWDVIAQKWVDVSTLPTTSNPQELMRLLGNRLIQEGDKLQWRPQAGVAGVTQQAFQMINWDDGTELTAPNPDAVPSEVQNLSLVPTGVGKLTASWNAPLSGNATSYTVAIVTQSGTIKPETSVYVTAELSYEFTGLSPANSYAVSVTACNAEGASAVQQDVFGSSVIALITADGPWSNPGGITVSSDGSVWFTLPRRNQIQQLTQIGGTWTLQPPIAVGHQPEGLVGISDGSIWVTNTQSSSVQQIKQIGVEWVAQPAIDTGGSTTTESYPETILSSSDGSVWFVNAKGPPFQQITNADGVWGAQEPINIPMSQGADVQPLLTAGPDGSMFATTYESNLFQLTQDNGTWQKQAIWPPNSSDSVVSSTQSYGRALTTGLDGAIWIGVTAGTESIARLTQTNDVWQTESSYEIPSAGKSGYFLMTVGLDGSIWFTNPSANTVQQLKAENGSWTLQAPLAVGTKPAGITTGLDGSIWLANYSSGTLQQIIATPNAPEALGVVLEPAASEMTLRWQPPQFSGGGDIIEYTATAAQGEDLHTITTTDLSCVFDGLVVGSGQTYFTVKATNFAGMSEAATYQIDASGNAFSTENSSIGVTTDGTPLPSGGGFDGQGNTFSWQAMADAASGGERVGTALHWGGVTFDLGAPNQPNLIFARGQELTVEELHSENDAIPPNMLNLLAASSNGATAATFQVNFTDGSSVEWNQTVSDWCIPTTETNQFIASTQTYRNTASGTQDATTNYLYAYSLKIPGGKVFESIGLPNNKHLAIFDVQMTTSVEIPTEMLANPNPGYTGYGLVVGNNNTNNSDGFDGSGNYYNVGSNGNSIGETIWGSEAATNYTVNGLSWGGAFFELGPAPNNAASARNPIYNNVIKAQGQTIGLPVMPEQQALVLMIGAAANGNQLNQEFRIVLEDTQGATSYDTWTQTFTDWRNNDGDSNNPPPTQQQLAVSGEALVAQTNVVNSLGNNQMKENAFVYGYAYEVPAGKVVVAIEFPTNENVGILAISTVWQA